MNFPLTLTGELRATFADIVSSPLPRRLSALMRRLNADHDERQEGDPAVGQAQQKRRAVLIVEDDAELRSLTADRTAPPCDNNTAVRAASREVLLI